jgi:redox-sensitive bicupin YhaK (pirin superfamily)
VPRPASRVRIGSIEKVALPSPSPTIEISPSRIAEVGDARVRRALPQRTRRTVGAWCFADHMGPMAVGPHPHMGIHTVTWLLEGALLHRDSLGSEQVIRPGELNVMTAGGAVSHAEEPADGYSGGLHGIQLWVAQPEATRHADAAFEHHPALPEIDLAHGRATVLVGSVDGVVSPAVHDTPLVGVDLEVSAGAVTVPLDPLFEHCLVVLDGSAVVDGEVVAPGALAYLGLGRDELTVATSGSARLLVLGGEPFESPVVMWWNFVGRTRQEMVEAVTAWDAGADRFGETGSSMARIPAPLPPWSKERLESAPADQGAATGADRPRDDEESPTDTV